MGLIEIILIIVGVVVLIISCVVPAGRAQKNVVQAPKVDEKMVRELVEKEIAGAKGHMNDMVEETLNYSMEKTERAMERLTNEKIMAINEYSEQVLTAINKNHQEVMFLYDMLNDKHANLVNTVSEASRKAKEIKQTVQDAEITVKEAAEMIAEETGTITGSVENVESTGGKIKSAEDAGGKSRTGNLESKDAGGKFRAGNLESKDTGGKFGTGNPGWKDTGGKFRAGNAELKDVDGDSSENPEKRDEVEFIPIAPKRVELVAGVIKEEEASGREDSQISPSESETEDEKNHNNNEKILRLHKLGKSKTAIAKELGLGVGEVKLVIDLFEQ